MFNQIVADTICALLEEGKSLRAACREVKVAPSTVLFWSKENKLFSEQYMRAREVGYKLLADELIDIADEKEVQARYQGEDVVLDISPNSIARNRLRVDTRKWMLSKMLPKIYGDKLDLNHSGEIGIVNAESLSDDKLAEIIENGNKPS